MILAFVLRFWALGVNPPSLYWDEVSQGYNAYSILKTGHDEHKELFPIARFQAFGDYKAPVYIYLDVLPIAIFGQSEFAVRFPSALFGTLTVLVCYFLVLELFFENKRKQAIAAFSAFFLAISPWHIQLSRVAYEANIATFFTITGLFLFLISVRKDIKFFLLSIISFVIAFYSFNAHRVFIPLLFLLLLILNYKKLFQNKKHTIISGFIGLLMLIPFLLYLRSPESRLRFNEVNIFSDISTIELSNRLVADDKSFVGKALDNRRVLYALSYVKHYFDFQDPSYLFFKGDQNPRFSTQENGELYLFMLPLILIGIYRIVRAQDKNKYLLFGWFILAPVAAATARETPHALRSETFIPIYEIFAGVGFYYFCKFLHQFKKYMIGYIMLAIFVFIALFSVLDFLHNYYVHLPQKYSQDFQYGYKQTIDDVEKIKNRYDRIIFTNAYGRAYIYVLWYGGYQPSEFWKEGIVSRDAFGFYNVGSFGKYEFNAPNLVNTSEGERVLYVGSPSEIPKDGRIIDIIKFLDGKSAFVIAEKT